MAPTREELNYAINHVFLPPKLPQSDDSENERTLLALTIDALARFKQIASSTTAQEAIDRAVLTLEASNIVHGENGINETALRAALKNLKFCVSLHVKEQNAGLIITKVGTRTNFEQFELSPQNASVFQGTGRLIRTFPASAISIDNNDLTPEAVSMIAQTLSTLSVQAAPGMQPQSEKSGQTHDESRDTTHPGMISEYFMSLLLPMGASISVPAITKRTREEVSWSNAKLPFRRSPLWLLIRVTIQLIFSRITLSSDLYKLFVTFLISQILETSLKALDPAVQSETIYFMQATIARRLFKLPEQLSTRQRPILDSINAVLIKSTEHLSNLWQTIQANHSRGLDLSQLSALDFEKDALVTISQLDTHIQSLEHRQIALVSAGYSPTRYLVNYPADQVPDLSQTATGGGAYLTAKLQAFEQWVFDHLAAWLSNHEQNSETCGKLADMLDSYYTQASVHYANNPEAFSVLLLTTLDIWVACDKAAIAACPMLSEYDAGIPVGLLQTLLLPFKAQMSRLHELEVYLHTRCGLAQLKETSLLYDASSPESFAARYYDTSPDHQRLHAEIEKWASETRTKKIAELVALQAEYRRLSRLIESTACETEKIFQNGTKEYTVSCIATCRRCASQQQLEALDITSHEWPLPRNATTTKVVTFELRVPQWYARWRDITHVLLRQVLRGNKTGGSPRYMYWLSSDCHLASKYFVKAHPKTNIGLLSQEKPFTVTHWRSNGAGTVQQKSVCVDSGLDYHYFNSATNTFGNTFTFGDEVSTLCTYRLPSNYRALQKFLSKSSEMPDGTPPNEVIASQADCPFDMSLQEFKELASLPLGHHIQWDNIMLQLRAPSIDFKKSETTMFILQCIYQAGPSNDTVLRAAHQSLAEPDLAIQVLGLLIKALHRVKENWESSQAISVFVSIATRVLSLHSDPSVHDACLSFLRIAREILYDWVQLLRIKSHDAPDMDTRTLFRTKSLEIALLCAASFDVDRDHLVEILTASESASMLIQCSITIHDGWESFKEKADVLNQIHHLRCRRLLYRCHDILAHHTLALNHAMSQVWSAYVPGSEWTSASDGCPEWVTCLTAENPGTNPLRIHFNTLTGELLVCGIPLNTAPQQYTQRALYTALFSNHIVEVMPSMIPGMQFSTKKSFNGFVVHMGMRDTELVVQASDGTSTFETIPPEFFQGLFPLHFAEDYIHWYDLTAGTVQFRLKSDPWNATSKAIWVLRRHGSDWRLDREQHFVVSSTSSASSIIAHFLEPLSVANGIHIMLSSSSKAVDIQIPALRLDFIIPRPIWQICSKQYRGMRIDEDQSLGTLHGLQNRLLLRNEAGLQQLLLPEAEQVTHQLSDHHVTVKLDTNAIRKVHLINVDKILGRLYDDGSIHAKLYLAYLHALTSSCLPDTLTRMTGTEQALSILRSAGVASFDQLSGYDMIVLINIAILTPVRQFYPQHLKQMQTVSWDAQLSSLSQHSEFVDVVATLFKQHTATAILYPDTETPTVAQLNISDKLLAERDLIRSCTIRNAGFGAEHHTDTHDFVYESRDQGRNSERALNVFYLSNMIYHKHGTRQWPVLPEYLWNSMASCQTVRFPNQQALSINRLRYDISLMQTTEQTCQASLVQINWPALHRLIAHGTSFKRRRYALMSFITTMAWSMSIDLLVLQCLCFIFTTSTVAAVKYPASLKWDVSPIRGKQPTDTGLTIVIQAHLQPFSRCPESSMPQNRRESRRNREHRTRALWETNKNSAVRTFVQALLAQWPAEIPVIPTDSATICKYVKADQAMIDVTKYFEACHRNILFFDYLSMLEAQVAELPLLPTNDHTCIKLNAVPPPASTTAYLSNEHLFLSSDEQLMQLDAAPLLKLATTATTEVVPAERPGLLSTVVAKLKSNTQRPPFELQYIAELEESIMCLRSYDGDQRAQVEVTLQEAIEYQKSCVRYVGNLYDAMVTTTTSGLSEFMQASCVVQQLPRVSPLFFLMQLSHGTLQRLPAHWKTCIIQYGIAITAMQRATRIVKLVEAGSPQELTQELQNIGHENWQPEDFPSSLLMEIESGFLIRPVQEQVAAVMRQPNGTPVNATVQLNMGAGKSSVIVPIVAAALADGKKLVRVVVAKPQSKQMAQMLLSKFGGILNRRIYYLPVSRAIRLDIAGAAFLGNMLRECMSNGGILLVQPEHILSFSLMGLESFINENKELGLSLGTTQDFLDNSSRDIVDESDENFSPRFEICYTMSAQRAMELCPERWLYIQQVFDLVSQCAPFVAREYPKSIMINKGPPGQFPRVRILRPEAGNRLVNLIAHHICDDGLPSFLKISRQEATTRDAIYAYLTRSDLEMEDARLVEGSHLWTDTNSPVLLLLRGLLAGGVLTFVLGQKRWRVNYGLADRTPPTKLAVPYRAKDNPSARSEYSHPDVVLTLTLLSYYYEGLTDDYLFTSLSHLMESDQKDTEYAEWVKGAANLPVAFRGLEGINIKDREQCSSQIFPALRHSKKVVDYFCSNIVFPKEMREFPHKLSGSGWDLGKLKTHPLTGFSGTKDSRALLPLNVEHLDLPEQRHTNALVLEYLLQRENSVKMLPRMLAQSTSEAEALLRVVLQLEPAVQVLLDVGAQIIEMDNLQVAQAWLRMHSDQSKQGAVFCNDNDELCVVDRHDRVELLQTSSFISRLDVCLIFLDEAHTRGIDLKLPQHFRAAVTLGANLVKDKLVQGKTQLNPPRVTVLGHKSERNPYGTSPVILSIDC